MVTPVASAQQASPVASAGSRGVVKALILEAEATGGVVGVAVSGAKGEFFAHDGDRRFRATSTIKAPIMIEAHREIDQGALDPTDRFRLRDEDRIPGSSVLSHMHAGLELTLADLLLLMIAVSDSTAANLILDRTGLEAVNATMQSLGMTNSPLGRRILGHLPKPGDPENWVTPQDFSRAIHAIVTHEAAPPESCEQMLTLLEQQGAIAVSAASRRPTPTCAGAPGQVTPGVINDVSYVSSGNGTLRIVVFCENLPDLGSAERTIGLIAREALVAPGLSPLAEGWPAPRAGPGPGNPARADMYPA